MARKDNDFVGKIPNRRELPEHPIDREKHRHALDQTVLFNESKVRQQRGKRRTVFLSPM